MDKIIQHDTPYLAFIINKYSFTKDSWSTHLEIFYKSFLIIFIVLPFKIENDQIVVILVHLDNISLILIGIANQVIYPVINATVAVYHSNSLTFKNVENRKPFTV